MKSKIAHSIKHRDIGDDYFLTPSLLAKNCIKFINIEKDDIILDAFGGDGVFYNNYPECKKDWCEIRDKKDFFGYQKKVDWIITNPPYSLLEKVLPHTYEICRKGFGYLLGINNLTPRRIEQANKNGFGLTKLHICKVFKWFGMSIFVVFEKGKENIITYDRIVWRVL